jgi:hypothetical protein
MQDCLAFFCRGRFAHGLPQLGAASQIFLKSVRICAQSILDKEILLQEIWN